MTRHLTGIQSSGQPHLGNILGAILPAVDDAAVRRANTLSVASAWLAFGCTPDNTVIYRQSMIPDVCELSWYLSCFTPVGLLRRAHAFKEKSKGKSEPKAGLQFYPVLMAADILLYDATHVPVGKDQQEHLDITRDIARSMNHIYGPLFTIPEPVINSEIVVPGTDGTKMSKSKNNLISVFGSDEELKDAVVQIRTSSAGLDDPKDPDSCTVFKLYAMIEAQDCVSVLREAYLKGGMGYGHAKNMLFESLRDRFEEQRDNYRRLSSNPALVEDMLQAGESQARETAKHKMEFIRDTLGF
jgi:tryptophanyl-tRNA synthetase